MLAAGGDGEWDTHTHNTHILLLKTQGSLEISIIFWVHNKWHAVVRESSDNSKITLYSSWSCMCQYRNVEIVEIYVVYVVVNHSFVMCVKVLWSNSSYFQPTQV